jgi:hypothetical protein
MNGRFLSLGMCALLSCVSVAYSAGDPNQATAEATQSRTDVSVVYSLELDDASVVMFHHFGSGLAGLSAPGPGDAQTIRKGLKFGGSFVESFERLRPGEATGSAFNYLWITESRSLCSERSEADTLRRGRDSNPRYGYPYT